MKGIDISNWQDGFNVAKADVDFAIFKATGGVSFIDHTCAGFVAQAKKAGKLWGFYHFGGDGQGSQDGKREADFFMAQTASYWGKGLPVLDLEDNGIANWGQFAKDFCERVYEKKKVWPVIYTGLRGISEIKGTGLLSKCKIWFAGYPKGYVNYWFDENDKPQNYYSIDSAAKIIIWQFTSAISMQGMNIDANIGYISKSEWAKLCGGSSKPDAPSMKDKVNKFCERMIYWCEKASLGYDQSNRWDIRDGGECDCSTLVYWCLWEAGILTKPKGNLYNHTLYTGTLRAHLKEAGYKELAVDLSQAKPGDILLNDADHVAAVVSGSGLSAKVAQASIGSNGKITGDTAGDQGNETNIRTIYNYPWNVIMRPPESGDVDPQPTPAPVEVKFRVKQGGKWQKENFAGTPGKKIQAIAIDMPGWYQVCTARYGWLPPVTGYDINEVKNGYAGFNDDDVLCVRAYYETPNPSSTGYMYAYYRVSDLGKDYWPWQIDNETSNGMDGYAGDFKPIDRFEINIRA